MNKLQIILLIGILALTGCANVRVAADYDRQSNFSNYTTYAFYKEGIDKVSISDFDKKRILRAIEQNLNSKGMQLSQTPDVLITFSTKEREQVNLYNNYFSWGWGPWAMGWGMPAYSVSTNIEGTLYIEIIDAKKKELIWQGQGVGNIPNNIEYKDKKIKEFVDKILAQYPPSKQK